MGRARPKSTNLSEGAWMCKQNKRSAVGLIDFASWRKYVQINMLPSLLTQNHMSLLTMAHLIENHKRGNSAINHSLSSPLLMSI